MAQRREVRYAWHGDVALARLVFGAGPAHLRTGVPDGWRLHRLAAG